MRLAAGTSLVNSAAATIKDVEHANARLKAQLKRRRDTADIGPCGMPRENADIEHRPKPTLIVDRLNYDNIFHHMVAWVSAWTALQIRGWGPPGGAGAAFDVLLVDEGREHQLSAADKVSAQVWGLFGSVSTIADIHSRSICFEDAIFPVQGWASFQLYGRWQDHQMGGFPACSPSRLFVDFVQWLVSALDRKMADTQRSLGQVRLQQAAIRRRHARVWAQQRRSDGKSPPLQIVVIGRSSQSSRQSSRIILNQDALVSALTHAASNFAAKQGLKANVTVMYMEQYKFSEAALAMASTDILVGMHGAGLTNLIFLPPTASLIELFNYGMGRERGDFEYQKLAALLGLGYANWTNSEIQKHHEGSMGVDPDVLKQYRSKVPGSTNKIHLPPEVREAIKRKNPNMDPRTLDKLSFQIRPQIFANTEVNVTEVVGLLGSVLRSSHKKWATA